MTKRRTEDRVLIGWNEYVDLPDWHIRDLRAKIDTGARTSSLHVEHLREISPHRVAFDVILDRRKSHRRVHVVAWVVRRSRVRSSTGHYEPRVFVKTRLRLGPVEREIEVNLVDRGRMIYRMLLGREALGAPFLIDASHRALQRRRRKAPKRTGSKPVRKKSAKPSQPR